MIPLGLERHEWRYLRQVAAHEPQIRAYLRSRVHDQGLVEDLLQEVYLALLEEGISNRPEVRSVFAFSLAIARNLANDRWRSRPPTSVEEIEELATVEDAVDEIVDSEERSIRLCRAVDALPERCQQAFRLQVCDDLTYKEIARELGTSEGTVGQYLMRARRLLRAALGGPLGRKSKVVRAPLLRRKTNRE